MTQEKIVQEVGRLRVEARSERRYQQPAARPMAEAAEKVGITERTFRR